MIVYTFCVTGEPTVTIPKAVVTGAEWKSETP